MGFEYYAAVHVKTESGDDYIFLFQYEVPTEIPVFIYRAIGEEMRNITDILVESQGFDSRHVASLIREAVNALD